MKILVRAPNWIGDQILAYPFFHYLRKAYPRAHITVACVPWVKDLQYRDLVNEVFELPQALKPHLWSRLTVVAQAARQIKKLHPQSWDIGIALPNSFSAAWFLWLSGARERIGYATDLRSLLLTHRESWSQGNRIHRAQAYVSLLPAEHRPSRSIQSFWTLPAESELDEALPGEKASFEWAKSWPGARPLRAPEKKYWVLAPGAAALSRRWSLDQFAQLVRLIEKEWQLTCVVVGGKSELELAESLKRDHGLSIVDYTARSKVSELALLLSQASFTVANDSGLAHVAALCGSPVQVVWGAGDPHRTQALGPGRVQIRFNPVECWPCEKNYCSLEGDRYLQCLKGMRADDVFEEIRRGFSQKFQSES